MDCRSFCYLNFDLMHISVGIHVAKGNPSKIFSPFLLPRNLKASSENIKDKLLVDFDPLRCYIADLQVSDSVAFDFAFL